MSNNSSSRRLPVDSHQTSISSATRSGGSQEIFVNNSSSADRPPDPAETLYGGENNNNNIDNNNNNDHHHSYENNSEYDILRSQNNDSTVSIGNSQSGTTGGSIGIIIRDQNIQTNADIISNSNRTTQFNNQEQHQHSSLSQQHQHSQQKNDPFYNQPAPEPNNTLDAHEMKLNTPSASQIGENNNTNNWEYPQQIVHHLDQPFSQQQQEQDDLQRLRQLRKEKEQKEKEQVELILKELKINVPKPKEIFVPKSEYHYTFINNLDQSVVLVINYDPNVKIWDKKNELFIPLHSTRITKDVSKKGRITQSKSLLFSPWTVKSELVFIDPKVKSPFKAPTDKIFVTCLTTYLDKHFTVTKLNRQVNAGEKLTIKNIHNLGHYDSVDDAMVTFSFEEKDTVTFNIRSYGIDGTYHVDEGRVTFNFKKEVIEIECGHERTILFPFSYVSAIYEPISTFDQNVLLVYIDLSDPPLFLKLKEASDDFTVGKIASTHPRHTFELDANVNWHYVITHPTLIRTVSTPQKLPPIPEFKQSNPDFIKRDLQKNIHPNHLKKQSEVQPLPKTFTELVKYFLTKDNHSFNVSEQKEINSLFDSTIDDAFELNDFMKHSGQTTVNQLFHGTNLLQAFYILLRIDNQLEEGIPDRYNIFSTIYTKKILSSEPFKPYPFSSEVKTAPVTLRHTLYKFISQACEEKYNDVKKLEPNMVITFAFYFLNYGNVNLDNRALLKKGLDYATRMGLANYTETITKAFRKYKDNAVTIINTFSQHFTLFINNPVEDNTFKTAYEILEDFLLSPQVSTSKALVPSLVNDNLDTCNTVSLLYRCKLLKKLSGVDTSFKQYYNNVLSKILFKDKEKFIEMGPYDFSYPKEALTKTLVESLLAQYKSNSYRLDGIMYLLSDNRLADLTQWFCNQMDVHNLKDKISLFNMEGHSYAISTIQQKVIAHEREGILPLSLAVPNYRFPALNGHRLDYAKYQDLTRYENEFKLKTPNGVLSSAIHTVYAEYVRRCADITIQNGQLPTDDTMSPWLEKGNVPSLPYLIMASRYLENQIRSLGSPKPQIYDVSYRLLTIIIPNNFPHWAVEIDTYNRLSELFVNRLRELIEFYKTGWRPIKDFTKFYDTLALILGFHGDIVETSQNLTIRYTKDYNELVRLRNLCSFISGKFGYKNLIHGADISTDIPLTKQITDLKNTIYQSVGLGGYTLLKESSINLISNFVSASNHKYFDIIFDYYHNNPIDEAKSTSIDVICENTLSFMTKLINRDKNIPLNQIFKDFISYKEINVTKELYSIYTYLKNNEPTDDYQRSFNEFIKSATSLFGINSNLIYLFKFLEEQSSHYIEIEKMAEDKKEIMRLQRMVDNTDMTIKMGEDLFNDLTAKIGGLNYYQLQYFSFINLDVIKFYASFGKTMEEANKGFDQANGVISSNISSDIYNSELLNNTSFVHKQVTLFIKLYIEKQTQQQKIDITTLCNMVKNSLPNDEEKLIRTFQVIKGVGESLNRIQGMFGSYGGGVYDESINVVVANILSGSTFESISTKLDDSIPGWFIQSNKLYKSEQIQEYMQGLYLFTNPDDAQKFEEFVRYFQSIHNIHMQLDNLYHPDYFGGKITVKFDKNTINKLQEEESSLKNNLQDWLAKIEFLPGRLLLLKAMGLSSLINGYNQMCKGKKKLDPIELATFLTPYISSCFPYATITHQMILSVLLDEKIFVSVSGVEDKQKLIDCLPIELFINEFSIHLMNIPESYEELDDHIHGPTLVVLDNKAHLYPALMQLCDGRLPHPSQLYYANNFASEFELFKRLVEKVDHYKYFLIGLPQEKDKLIQWLSEHYSDQTTNKLAKFYIISTEGNNNATNLFSFLPQQTVVINELEHWPTFKVMWSSKNDQDNIGIESLNLVHGPSGTGKTWFIRNQRKIDPNIRSQINVLVRPNFTKTSLIEQLNGIIKRKEIENVKHPLLVLVHFDISPYYNFEEFNHFIYPLIYGGVLFGDRLSQVVNIVGRLKLRIFVEVGDQLPNSGSAPLTPNPNQPAQNNFIFTQLPLVAHLAQLHNQPRSDWNDEDLVERICYSHYNQSQSQYQRPDISRGKSVTVTQYIEYVCKKLKSEFDYKADYLLDQRNLLHRKNFFRLLSERLEFLHRYYGYYATVGLEAQTTDKQTQKGLLSPPDLYNQLLLESCKLADPSLSSAAVIWSNPPTLTARSIEKISNGFKEEDWAFIDYVVFGNSTGEDPFKNRDLSSLIDIKKAKAQPGEMRVAIGRAFGLGSRTDIILTLCKQFNYVMTPEFALRLLVLHNKVKNSRSLVLSGDTGVGKTHNLLFYSLLINGSNAAVPDIFLTVKETANDFIKQIKTHFNSTVGKDGVELKYLPGNPTVVEILELYTQLADFEPKPTNTTIVPNTNPPPALPAPGNNNNALANPQTEVAKVNQLGSSGGVVNFQPKLFLIVEKMLCKLLEQYKLIEILPKGELIKLKRKLEMSHVDQKIDGSIITDKEKMLACINEILTVKFKNLFIRKVMHQKVSAKELKLEISETITQAEELQRIDSKLKMVLFIDEFNTAPDETLSLINEMFCNSTMDGDKRLPSNMFLVGAMNPRKRVANVVDYSGQYTANNEQAFVVKDVPPSLRQLTLNYGEFGPSSEESFLDSLFTLTPVCSSQERHNEFRKFITTAQRAMREVPQSRTHVSIRDIVRVIELYQFFTKNPVGKKILEIAEGEGELIVHWWAMVCSIAMSYLVRMEHGKNRTKLADELNRYFSNAVPEESKIRTFDTLFKHIYTVFCSKHYTKLPPGIALTDSLQLNIFCIAVSISCRIPICIVGPPGCSKTLSFGIVLTNMNRNKYVDKKNTVITPWALMSSADPFRYQCTQHTTDIEIKHTFDIAMGRQKMFDPKNHSCVVFFDEAGLVNENDSPMKIMHDYLDKLQQKIHMSNVDVATVILSNKILDAAKTNRMMVLIHPPNISQADEDALAVGILYNNIQLDATQKSMCQALCEAYRVANTYVKSKVNLFHQRDFVYFLRHLARSISRNKDVISAEIVLRSLERNFGGIPFDQFKELANKFLSLLNQHVAIKFDKDTLLSRDNTIECIKESLQEKLLITEDPGTCPFRYVLVVDPTENESSLMLLNELGLVHNPTIIRVGGFENDTNTDSLALVVSQIKNAMSTGGTVVLVNTQLIDACFYDVINRYFVQLQTANSVTLLAQVSFGTHSMFCPVHPDFKIIVHLPLSRLPQTQLPWLNRFEKYYLSLESIVDHFIDSRELKNDQFQRLKQSANHFVNHFHYEKSEKSLLAGFSESETIPSLIYTFAKNMVDQKKRKLSHHIIAPHRLTPEEKNDKNQLIVLDDEGSNETDIFKLINWKLMQIARPESIFKCRSTLPTPYIAEYLSRQQHFNGYHFLKDLFTKKFAPEKDQEGPEVSNKWVLFTRSSLVFHRLKEDKLDKFHSLLSDTIPLTHRNRGGVSTLKILQLHRFKSSVQCKNEINDFFKNENLLICMIIADMSTTNQHQLNFVSEQFTKMNNTGNKMMLTICHYPPEFSLSNQTKLNAIFLNGVEYFYFDSLGIKIDSDVMNINGDVRTWFANVHGLKTQPDPESLEKSFHDIFFNHLKNIAFTTKPLQIFSNLVPGDEKDFYSTSKVRSEETEKLFKKNPSWYRQVITTFSNNWNENNLFLDIFTNITDLLLTGKLVHSIIEAVESSLTSYMYPVISNIFKALVNYQSFGRINMISDATPLDREFVKVYIETIEQVNTNQRDIDQHYFQPLVLNQLQSELNEHKPKLPLYDTIAIELEKIFDLVRQSRRNVNSMEKMLQYLQRYIKIRPIGKLINHIDRETKLQQAYQEDFVTRTLKFGDSKWTPFVVSVICNLYPVKQDSILQFIVAHHFYSNTISFIRNMVAPLLLLKGTGEGVLMTTLGEKYSDKVIKSTEEIKSTTAQISTNTLFNHIKKRPNTNVDADLLDWTSNWCKVMGEIFNRLPFTQIMKHVDQQNKLTPVYLHTIYTLCLYVSVEYKDEQIPKVLGLLYKHIYITKDIKNTFTDVANQFETINQDLEKLNIEKLKPSAFLECIEPLINIDNQTITSFFRMIDYKLYPEYDLYSGVFSTIPFGWVCNIIRGELTNQQNHQTKYNNIINAELAKLDLSRISNPLSLAFSGGDIPAPVLSLLGCPSMNEYNQYHLSNRKLVDVMFYVYLEDFKSKPNLSTISGAIVQWKELVDGDTITSTIEQLALSARIIELLVQLINAERIASVILFLKNNHILLPIIKAIFSTNNGEPIKDLRNRWFHVHLFNKISPDTTLLEFLKSKELLSMVGLEEHYIPIDMALPESTSLPFVSNDKISADGQLYSKLLDLITKSQPITPLLEEASKSQRTCGFLRMALFLITYDFYIEQKPLDYLKQLLGVGSPTVNQLGLAKYLKFFNKILLNQFFTADGKQPATKFDSLIMRREKSRDEKVRAQIMVNCAALGIGSNSKFFMYHLLSDTPFDITHKYFVACETIFRDCGMIYRLGTEIEPIQCMRSNHLYKFIIATSIWGGFTWQANKVNSNTFKALIDPKLHFVNFLTDKTIEGLTDYINERSLVSYAEMSASPTLAQQHVEPGHYLSELLYRLWSDSYSDTQANNPVLRSKFDNVNQVQQYEDYLIGHIENLITTYPLLKKKRLDSIIQLSKSFNQIVSTRDLMTQLNTTPFFTLEAIYNTVNSTDNYKLLSEFMGEIQSICCSKYFRDIIQFLRVSFRVFSYVLPQEYQHRTFKECLEYLKDQIPKDDPKDDHNGYVTSKAERDYRDLEESWERLLKGWGHIKNLMSVMKGGCAAMPEYEKNTADISNQTLFSELYYEESTAQKGHLLEFIIKWMDNPQHKLLDLARSDCVVEKSRLPTTKFFKQIATGFTLDLNIDDVPFEYEYNYLLIGSTSRPSDIQQYIYQNLSHYHSFNRNEFKPNYSKLTFKIIYSFLTGKIDSKPKQLSAFLKQIPWKLNKEDETAAVEQANNKEKNNKFTNIIPSTIKELISLKDRLANNYGEPIKEEYRIPLESRCKSHSENLEKVTRYLISTIGRIIYKQKEINLDLEQTIVNFSKEYGVPENELSIIEEPIQKSLEVIPIKCIKTTTKTVIDGYLSFGYLYANVVKSPVIPNQGVMDNINNVKGIFTIQATENKKEWIQYLQEIIHRLSSIDCIEVLKKQQPQSMLADHTLPFLQNIQSPQTSNEPFDIHSIIQQLEIPLAYYPFFMRAIHEVLSITYLDVVTNEELSPRYKEPYAMITKVKTEVESPSSSVGDWSEGKSSSSIVIKENIQSSSSSVTLSELKEQELKDQEQKQDDGKEEEEEAEQEGVEDNYHDYDMDDLDQDEDGEHVENDYNLSQRPIQPDGLEYLHCLFNWIRYKQENLYSSITNKTGKNESLYKLLVQFWRQSQKMILTPPINIKELIIQTTPTSDSNPGESIISILRSLSDLDSSGHINNWFNFTTQNICTQCNQPYGQKISNPILFDYTVPNDPKPEQIECIFNHYKNKQNFKKKQAALCDLCKQSMIPQTKLVSAPTYIFVYLERNSKAEKSHKQIQNNDFFINSYFDDSDHSYQFCLHSIMCQEDSFDGKSEDYSIYIKHTALETDEAVKFMKCTTENIVVDLTTIFDHVISNSVLLIYENVGKSLIDKTKIRQKQNVTTPRATPTTVQKPAVTSVATPKLPDKPQTSGPPKSILQNLSGPSLPSFLIKKPVALTSNLPTGVKSEQEILQPPPKSPLPKLTEPVEPTSKSSLPPKPAEPTPKSPPKLSEPTKTPLSTTSLNTKSSNSSTPSSSTSSITNDTPSQKSSNSPPNTRSASSNLNSNIPNSSNINNSINNNNFTTPSTIHSELFDWILSDQCVMEPDKKYQIIETLKKNDVYSVELASELDDDEWKEIIDSIGARRQIKKYVQSQLKK